MGATFLTQFLSILGGGVNTALGYMTTLLKSGFNTAVQFHKEGIALGRDLGLSFNQAQAYTKALTERTAELANKYGVTAEAIKEVQRGISEATNKQLLLNDSQTEGFVQINKLVGAQTTNKFVEEIMNGMGGQIDTVQGAISKVYATAAKQGLNAKKLTDKVAQNLSMANRLSFRNGIDGITRMAALSEKLGINMASVESAAGKFMDLDQAIENAAHMQMLGGSAAVNFGNPLTAAYEANYDPEAFAQRMSDSLASYATFDKSKGIANVNGMNMSYVREIAKILGVSVDDATKMAKKQSEVRYKETALGGVLNSVAGNDEAKRNYILNNAQVTNNGQDMEINGKNVKEITDEEWEKMMAFEGMDDSEIMRIQAEKLTSIDEQLSGAATSISAAFAQGLNDFLPGMTEQIQAIGEYLKPYAGDWGTKVGQGIQSIFTWVQDNGHKIKTIADWILDKMTKFITLVTDYWKVALGLWAGFKIAKWASGLTTPAGNSLGARAGKGLWSGLKGLFTTSRDTNIATRMGYADARAAGNGRFMSALKAPFRGASLLSTGQKVANIGGAALGVGLSVAQGFMAQSAYKDQVEAINKGEWDRNKYNTKEEALAGAQTERNAGMGGAIGGGIGTVIGTALGGPVGAMIGGAIGKFAGEYIGKNWTKITEWMSKSWDKVVGAFTALGGWIKDKWQGVVGWFKSVNWAKVGETLITIFMPPVRGIIEVVKHWDEIKDWFSQKWDGAVAAVRDGWNSIKEAWNTNVEQPIKDFWAGVKTSWNDNVMQPAKDLWNGIKEAWDKYVVQPIKSVIDNIKEGWEKLKAGIQKFIDDPLGTMKEGAKSAYESGKNWVKDKANKIREFFGFEEGGVIGGDSYTGDRQLIAANSGEAVITPKRFNALFDMAETIIKAQEYGAKQEYIYKPKNSETSNINGNKITVNDVNVNLNVSGTLRLDGGNGFKNVDASEFMNNPIFMAALKDKLMDAINREMHAGRFNNDLAVRTGQLPHSIV